MATRANIGWTLENMIPGKAGYATPRVIHKTEDGIMDCYGTSVPSDGASGYAVGCTFRHVDADVLASGTVDSGDATSLIDATLASTYNTNDELIGYMVVDTNKKIMGKITDYAYATGDITVDDWTDYDGTAVANTIYPAAGDLFEILRVSTRMALFVNVGDDVQGCKFQPMVTSEFGKYTSLDHHKGPSPQIWKDCPILEMMVDPGMGFYYFTDFVEPLDPTNACGWEVTQATSGSLDSVIGVGGEMVASAGAGTADQGVNAQLLNCCVKPAAGKTIWFEARVQVSHKDNQIFVGIASTDTTLIATGALDETNPSSIGFFTDVNSTTLKGGTITQKAGTNDTTEDNIDVAAATWYNLGFKVTGITKVEFFQNGKLIETGTTAASIPDAVEMALSLVCQNEDGANTNTLTIDWLRIAQLR